MPPRRLLASALVALALASPAAAFVAEPDQPGAKGALSEALKALGWELLTLPGRRPARFALAEDGAVQVMAEDAVAFLYRPVSETQRDARRLTWRWRVDEFVPSTDLAVVGEDDRSVALHICFPADEGRMSFWERFSHSLKSLAGAPLSGHVLTYVWGGIREPGSVFANPHMDSEGEARGTIIVLRSDVDQGGRWLMEEVDFVADFERVFGYSPPPPAYVAISADSDDTSTRALAFVNNLSFGP